MFQDEAGFGRINKPKRCWCSKKTRPSVPCHHIREYRYAYGAVEPIFTAFVEKVVVSGMKKEVQLVYVLRDGSEYKTEGLSGRPNSAGL